MTKQQATYLRFIKQKIRCLPSDKVDEMFVEDADLEQDRIERYLRLLTQLADFMRAGKNCSIDKAIDDSVRSGFLSSKFRQYENREQVRVTFFNFIAWISMLYPPKSLVKTTEGRLTIDSTQCMCMLDTQAGSNANLPICEVIQEFGPLLPVRRDSSNEGLASADPVFSKDSLYVSLLNAKTLSQIGGIEIVWIDHLSSHLVFDPETKKMFLYRLPSFSYINRFQGSAIAMLVVALAHHLH